MRRKGCSGVDPWRSAPLPHGLCPVGALSKPAGGLKTRCGLQMVHSLEKEETEMRVQKAPESLLLYRAIINPYDSSAKQESPVVGQVDSLCTAALHHHSQALRERLRPLSMESDCTPRPPIRCSSLWQFLFPLTSSFISSLRYWLCHHSLLPSAHWLLLEFRSVNIFAVN